jgi:hypothetical protein
MNVEFAAGSCHTVISDDAKDAGGSTAGIAWFLMLRPVILLGCFALTVREELLRQKAFQNMGGLRVICGLEELSLALSGLALPVLMGLSAKTCL